jgi:pantetheine-phosphate adenylyltransferase
LKKTPGRGRGQLIRAMYPGSFDPITNGHIYIAERAAAIFSELTVGVLNNSQKTYTFSKEERETMTREALSHLPNVKVKHFEGCWSILLRARE